MRPATWLASPCSRQPNVDVLVFCAPEEIRVRFKDRYKTGLVTEAAAMRPRKGSDPVTYTKVPGQLDPVGVLLVGVGKT